MAVREDRLSQVTQLFEEAIDRHQEAHERMGEEMAFALYLDHYEDEAGHDMNRSPERVQPRGRELKQLINHIVAQISKSRFYFDVRPVDSDMVNAFLAEVVKGALESEIYNPMKDFEGCRDRALLQAVAARMGYVAIEYDRSVGPWGEILFRNGDGRRLMWAKGHASPHDPRCPWVIEVLRVQVSEIKKRRGWKNTDNLAPDGDYLYPSQFRDDSHSVFARREHDSFVRGTDTDGEITVCWLWERNLNDTRQVERKLEVLSAEKRYMECTVCKARGVTQEELGSELPEEDICPECGGMAMRQDALMESDVELANRQGKRLTIFAPAQKRIFVELNEWPHELPTVPYMVYKWEDHPVDPYGVSMTFEHWTMQLAADMVTRLGLEHMALAKPYTVQQRGAFTDYKGDDWSYGPDQGLQIFYSGAMPTDKAITMLQAAGLPPAWNSLDQSIQGKFASHTGTSDLALSPTNSKDIPASTIAQYIEQGELPVQHLVTRVRRADTVGMQVLYHLIRKTWVAQRWIELHGIDGQQRMQLVSGDELPNYNVVVTSNPEVQRMDLEEVQAWAQFMQLGAAGMEFVGKRLGIPATEMQRLAEQMRQQEMVAGAQAAAAGGGAGQMLPPPGQPEGVNGPGPSSNQEAQIAALMGQAQGRF